ncbi:MAG: hypothetical protein PVH24_06195 [Candidatus Zixiibacteriota bacterium]|jgi:hypothetical protein
MKTNRVHKRGHALVSVVPLLLLLGTVANADSFSATIASFADDAKVYEASLETTAGDAMLGHTTEYSCGVLARFVPVSIPRHATIDSAFVSLKASGSQSEVTCNAVVCAEDTGNASTFSTYSDLTARSVTDEVVYWDNLPAMMIFNWYRTPDLSSVIQQVIDRSDWHSGNALALLIQDNNSNVGAYRRFWQYDYLPQNACSLIVYYTAQPESGPGSGGRRRILVGKLDYTGPNGQVEGPLELPRGFFGLCLFARRGGNQ